MHVFRRWCGLDWFHSTTDSFAIYFQEKTTINWFVDRTALLATPALAAAYIILNVYPSAFLIRVFSMLAKLLAKSTLERPQIIQS